MNENVFGSVSDRYATSDVAGQCCRCGKPVYRVQKPIFNGGGTHFYLDGVILFRDNRNEYMCSPCHMVQGMDFPWRRKSSAEVA